MYFLGLCQLESVQVKENKGLPWWLNGKESACQSRRCEMWVQSLSWQDPNRGGHGNPLQYPCLENPMDREAWRVTVHGVAKS